VRRAKTNALNHLKNEIQKAYHIKEHLKEIQKKFHLPVFPQRIECYDISHWQGSYPVGSGVVFEEGEPLKKDYRLYNLRSVPDGDDYLALQEVLSRRLKHTEWKSPDLILIDGGRGQLKVVKSLLESYGKKDWSVISLAKDRLKKVKKEDLTVKKNDKLSKKKASGKTAAPALKKNKNFSSTGERFFLPGRKNPIVFPSQSKALKILLHLRDEAHRFAIQSHRKKRDKNFLKK